MFEVRTEERVLDRDWWRVERGVRDRERVSRASIRGWRRLGRGVRGLGV